jgi:DNA polymerase III epsilon subunit-like protein
MKEELLRFNKKQKYIIFDYETCNLNLISTDNKPWQLAFMVFQADKILDQADYILNWKDIHVSKEAAKITGFTKTMYNKRKSCPRKALEHFEKYLYDESIIPLGHNVLGFDVYIHNIHRKLLKKTPDYSYINRIIDTVCLARSIKKNIEKKNNSERLPWMYKLLNIRERGLKVNLQQCCKDYDIDFDPNKLHDAMYDIKKNMEVFSKMLWEVEV